MTRLAHMLVLLASTNLVLAAVAGTGTMESTGMFLWVSKGVVLQCCHCGPDGASQPSPIQPDVAANCNQYFVFRFIGLLMRIPYCSLFSTLSRYRG